MSNDLILRVEHLRKKYLQTKGWFQKVIGEVQAVDDVSFTIKRGETLALVGESGCGKTTTGKCILAAEIPDSGKITFYPPGNDEYIVSHKNAAALKKFRMQARMIFQDPYSSLNARMTVEKIISEPVIVNEGIKDPKILRRRVAENLEKVHLDTHYMSRYPHAFSGGQRQRIAIARALVLNPKLIIADEPVSALDVSVQAQMLNLLNELKEREGISYLFIAHNLAVVRYQADRVAVMYLGRIVELAERDEIFGNPCHPYMELLLACCPVPDPMSGRREILDEGVNYEVGYTGNIDREQCLFKNRCKYACDKCDCGVPALREIRPGHFVACHRAEELHLKNYSEPDSAYEKNS